MSRIVQNVKYADAGFKALVSSSVLPRKKMERVNSKRSIASPHHSNKSHSSTADRFIPDRSTMNKDLLLHHATQEHEAPTNLGEGDAFSRKLAEVLFSTTDLNSRVLSMKNKPPVPSAEHQNDVRMIYRQNKATTHRRKERRIAANPTRVLDAPGLADDFYLNLIDWSGNERNNRVAIALGSALFIWNAETGKSIELCDFQDQVADGQDYEKLITSVKWTAEGSHVAVGTSDNEVQLWDIAKERMCRTLQGHSQRVGTLSWNNHVLSSGSRDSTIINHDVRIRQHRLATLSHHTQEVCGLTWSPDGTQLASGGNDNLVCIWDANNIREPKHALSHSAAAVKALAWCPFQPNLLATGGGTADRHIRFYNTSTGRLLNSIDTGSQVCSLVWSRHNKELVSGHGYAQNQLTVWKYPSMVKVTELESHTERVLNTCISPDGTTVLSSGADENLCFWKVWDKPCKKKRRDAGARSMMGRSIR